ncbi:hypothetical protein F4777DRAFT_581640 [Nemania sp. FL0916]|nr:hypothetical protein F4777DRAFT_581640 [Nemania sp. FL0916]
MSKPIDEKGAGEAPAPSSNIAGLMLGFDKWGTTFEELEAAKRRAEEAAQEWERKFKTSEENLNRMVDAYESKCSEQWELRNRHDDQTRELEILRLALQNSIPLADWISPPLKLKTALETIQEEMIQTLRQEKEDLRAEVIQSLREDKENSRVEIRRL